MRLGLDGVRISFIIMFLLVVGNVFFTGFNTGGSGLNFSSFLFYSLILIVVSVQILIGRVDFIFIIGCGFAFVLKILGISEFLSDTLMIAVIAWGISYLRYDLSALHFKLIFIYGCISILVSALQLLGVEQLHVWNTLMTISEGKIDSSLAVPLFSSPVWLVEQSQMRPPGLFHSNAVFSLFVCYFYASLLQKSFRLLPLGLLAVWICGSKISFIFSILYPFIMLIQKNNFPRLSFLWVVLTTAVFFTAMFVTFPELSERKYAIDSFLFSALLRMRNLDQILNLGFNFDAVSAFDGLRESKGFTRDDTVLSGVFGGIIIGGLFLLFGFKRLSKSLTKNSAEIVSIFFVSLATPVVGHPFCILILYPIFATLRERKLGSQNF